MTPTQRPGPTWRIPFGMLLILLIIMVLAIIVVTQSYRIANWPIIIQAVIYLIAGTIWIAPLRPLLQWMETGKWRE